MDDASRDKPLPNELIAHCVWNIIPAIIPVNITIEEGVIQEPNIDMEGNIVDSSIPLSSTIVETVVVEVEDEI